MLYKIRREYGYICYVLAVGDDKLGVGDDELGVGDDEDASSEAAEGEAHVQSERSRACDIDDATRLAPRE